MRANLPSTPQNRNATTEVQLPPTHSQNSVRCFSEMLDWMLVPLLVVWPLLVGITYLIGINIANGAFDRSLGGEARALAEQLAWINADKKTELRADLRTILSDDDTQSNSFRIDSGVGLFCWGSQNCLISCFCNF